MWKFHAFCKALCESGQDYVVSEILGIDSAVYMDEHNQPLDPQPAQAYGLSQPHTKEHVESPRGIQVKVFQEASTQTEMVEKAQDTPQGKGKTPDHVTVDHASQMENGEKKSPKQQELQEEKPTSDLLIPPNPKVDANGSQVTEKTIVQSYQSGLAEESGGPSMGMRSEIQEIGPGKTRGKISNNIYIHCCCYYMQFRHW